MRGNLWIKNVVGLLLVLLVAPLALADVELASPFTDHMVIQREMAVPVWGWADADEKVTVTLGDQTKSTSACGKGKWSVKLDPVDAGGPYVLKVQGANKIEINDVLVGEVWVCSGQSNMAMSVASSANYPAEQAAANHPKIRMFGVARRTAAEPQEKCGGAWAVCSPTTVGGFSAAAYFFGRRLHKELGVPVGLINTSWGGTPVQAWTCLDVQKSMPELKPMLESWEQRIASYDPEAEKERYEKRLAVWKDKAAKAKEAGQKPPRRPRPPVAPDASPHRPASLYNGMITPLAPYAIRGGIWYQGESNAGGGGTAKLYGLQLQAMIVNWRNMWDQGDFQFIWVQLPNFRAPQTQPSEPSGWVTVCEEMKNSLSLVNTGMAVTIDIGEEKDIHPKNKQDVGKRLAQWALATTYKKDMVACGPLYKSMAKKGDKIVLQFDHTDGGLVAKDGGPLKGFAIAGADRKFVWADAKIIGDTVVVSSPEVKDPVAVRYAWATNPIHGLLNKAGLPASLFRTDDWEK